MLERISEWLRSTAATAISGTARRPKRVHWSDTLTADLSVMIRQEESQLLHADSDSMIWRQGFACELTLIDADADTDSIETRIAEAVADVITAFEADPTCGGEAMFGGLIVGAAADMTGESGRISGQSLAVDVTYSHEIGNLNIAGLR